MADPALGRGGDHRAKCRSRKEMEVLFRGQPSAVRPAFSTLHFQLSTFNSPLPEPLALYPLMGKLAREWRAGRRAFRPELAWLAGFCEEGEGHWPRCRRGAGAGSPGDRWLPLVTARALPSGIRFRRQGLGNGTELQFTQCPLAAWGGGEQRGEGRVRHQNGAHVGDEPPCSLDVAVIGTPEEF